MSYRNSRFAAIGLALAVLCILGPGGLASPGKANAPTAMGGAAASTTSLTGIHDPLSRNYDSDCVKCHASILKESSRDPRILAFHQAMIPYTPGYSARKGVQSKNCVTCHRDAIDFRQESGSSLRRTVSIESCVYCHGRTGPGPAYFE
ncbi:MAG TPA: hypothetical protein VF958_08550 [Thermoanaerobaculia bacterium]